MERLLVIGGDAAGLSAASQARRRRSADDLAITVFERGPWISYSACGEPYFISGEVDELTSLLARTPEQFAQRDIHVHRHHDVVEIDLDARTATARTPDGGTRVEPFDQLVYATGASAIRPPIEGLESSGVHVLRTLDDASAIESAAGQAETALVIGAGYIGLEVAEALVGRGLAVTIVDIFPSVLMRTLEPRFSPLIEAELVRHGVEVHLDTRIEAIHQEADGRVVASAADTRFTADLVVMGGGATPNTDLAAEAGIPLGETGAVAVDERQRTRADGVWAAGDCAEARHRITGRPVNYQLGTVANKQGRVAGINLGGGDAVFPGVLGTAITRVFDLEVARTGLDDRDADEAGMRLVTGTVESTTTAGYMPGAAPLTVAVTVDGAGTMVGGQIVGGPGAGKRIDTLATAIWAGLGAEDFAMADLSYAPPFSGVWDPVAIAARRAGEAVTRS
jgi:NADPH-dependent 2,4-dienoyl-CoA reductase/sulfur reductase-like enzyme